MNDLRDLYQDIILDHSRHPRQFKELPSATHHADGHNPLCGDRISLALEVRDGVIQDIAFTGSGCAISTASTSMMCQALKGQPVVAAQALFEKFHLLLTGQWPESQTTDELGKLAAFAGVAEFPVRVKCATLAWHTLKAALEREDRAVSTEA